jgi:hypothetical protein
MSASPPTWLFEADAFGTSMESLKAELRRLGVGAFTTSLRLLATRAYLPGGRALPDDACVIACGSFPFVRSIQLHHPWVPGAWCSTDDLDCRAYYPRFGDHLLNRRHVILPVAEVVSRSRALVEEWGEGGRVFARPSGPQKTFTGRCLSAEEMPVALSPARYDESAFVVLAPPRVIEREWRLVVADRVIASSQYLEQGELAVSPGCPQAVHAFAERALAEVAWRPDELFILDVCEAEGGLHVLEVGGFSCCGLYACDPAAIARTANDLAARAWDHRHGS